MSAPGSPHATPNRLAPFYWLMGVLVLGGTLAVLYGLSRHRLSAATAQPIPTAAVSLISPDLTGFHGVTVGSDTAQATILEFADYECPACRLFFETVEPSLMSDFVRTGRARFVVYDYPLETVHPHAVIAAQASHCAQDQDRFWEYREVLYRNQAVWAAAEDPGRFLERYAASIGLDPVDFEHCLRTAMHADIVASNTQLGNRLQVVATPTIIVVIGGGMGRRVEATTEAIRAALP